MRRTGILIAAMGLVYAVICGCDDPASATNTVVVQTLVHGQLPAGQYSVFWDGRDEKNAFMGEGTYLVWLYARDFTYEIQVTALSGGVTGVNDSTTAPIFGNWGLTELLPNHPEPFRIKSGTNIPFIIGEDAADKTVEITVRKEAD